MVQIFILHLRWENRNMKHTWTLLWRQLCFLYDAETSSLWNLNKNTKSLYLHNALVSIVILHQVLQNTMSGRKMYFSHVFFKWKKSKTEHGFVVCIPSQRKWKNWDLNESLRTPNLELSLLPQSLTMEESKSSSVKTHTFHCRRLRTK